jgi:hypothetical protein
MGKNTYGTFGNSSVIVCNQVNNFTIIMIANIFKRFDRIYNALEIKDNYFRRCGKVCGRV